MILKLFSIKDNAIGAFGGIIIARADGEAIRSFADAMQNPQQPFGKHPNDFDLYRIGTFNDEDGAITPTPAQRVMTGRELADRKGE